MQSALELLKSLKQFRILETERLQQIAKQIKGRRLDARGLAQKLIQSDDLTPYQANLLLKERGKELLLGSYVLTERLGEGGMGAVFKARNWKLGYVCALKIIRKDRINNPDTVKRFEREIRAAAQLEHPNIVRAIDADEVDGTHLLAMEYVAGEDLAKIVKRDGPLPIKTACEYIRQAAVGLQHAHERGMVHRDIKPQNLLVARGEWRVAREVRSASENTSRERQRPDSDAVVKILDMGLARFARSEGDSEASATMTQEGMIMGTLDYIAPEQATDAHSADIRADIYSLGCTFYYLLTGRVPFPGGDVLAKLMRHKTEEPRPIEDLRSNVPPVVATIVRQMMAKDPEQRFQMPGELAETLEQLLADPNSLSETSPVRAAAVRHGEVSDATLEVGQMWEDVVAPAGVISRKPPRVRISKNRPATPSVDSGNNRWRALSIWAGVAGVFLLPLIVLLIVQPWQSNSDGPQTKQTPPKKRPPKQKSDPNIKFGKNYIELFNGKDLTGWLVKGTNRWVAGKARFVPEFPNDLFVDTGDGDLICGGMGGNIYTEKEFGDCVIDLEFALPKGSNSGIYVMGEYEIQLLQSSEQTVTTTCHGALYGKTAPLVFAGKKPSEWERIVIDFEAPRFEKKVIVEGARFIEKTVKVKNARLRKVVLNGKVIHEDVEIPGPLPQGLTGREAPTGPLMFQGSHGPVAYRNIRVYVR